MNPPATSVTKPRRRSTVALTATLAVAAVALVAVGLTAILGDDDASGGGAISVDDAWTAPNQTVTAVYLTITNPGADDRLVGVATDQAGTASIMGDASLTDMPAEGAVPVDLPVPSGTTTLQPGGRHLMLEDLTGTLDPGSSFTVRLTFERAGTISVTVDVLTWDQAVERTDRQ